MGNTALKFKIGDKVKYKGAYVCIWGVNGIIVEQCPVDPNCKGVKFTDNRIHHVYVKDLVINKPKQQLLFTFMG